MCSHQSSVPVLKVGTELRQTSGNRLWTNFGMNRTDVSIRWWDNVERSITGWDNMECDGMRLNRIGSFSKDSLWSRKKLVHNSKAATSPSGSGPAVDNKDAVDKRASNTIQSRVSSNWVLGSGFGHGVLHKISSTMTPERWAKEGIARPHFLPFTWNIVRVMSGSGSRSGQVMDLWTLWKKKSSGLSDWDTD